MLRRALLLLLPLMALFGCSKEAQKEAYVYPPVKAACRLIALLENPNSVSNSVVIRELDVSQMTAYAFRKVLRDMPGSEVHVWMPGASHWLLVSHLTTNRVSMSAVMDALAMDEECVALPELFASYAGTREEIMPAFEARLEGNVVPEWFVTKEIPVISWLDESDVDADILRATRTEMRSMQVVRRIVLEGNILAASAKDSESEEKVTDMWSRAALRNPRDLLLRERIDRLERNAKGFLAVGKLLQAMKCYETIMLIQPRNSAAVHNFGLCLKRLGKLDLADKALKRAGLRLLLDQFREVVAGGTKSDGVEKFVHLVNDDGSFSDLDYAITGAERGTWKGVDIHLARLRQLAASYYREPSFKVMRAFHLALCWWFRNDPKNPNWWWNEIGAPRQIGEAALMALPLLTDEERSAVVGVLRRADGSVKRTGQNRVWLERIRLMRAMLIDDPAVADFAIKSIMEEVKVSDKEGVKCDGSFHQHGAQPQLGNYGLSYVSDMLDFVEQFNGTPWEFSEEKLDVLRLLMCDGYRWISWKGMIDVSSMNRQIFPNMQRTKGAGVERCLEKMRKLDPTFPKEAAVGFKFYPESAYAIYRTTNWMASVKMHTPGIKRTETWINDENTRGVALCDGALFTYFTGREYEEVFPLWNQDWRMLPGVTARRGLSTVEDAENRPFNRANFCRGYEKDGRSVVEFHLDKEGLKAQKRWTFAPDGIICEGSAIFCDAGNEVVTTVEACIAQANAKIFPYADGALRIVNGDFEYRIEAPETSIHAAIEERSGDYRFFNLRYPSCKRQGKVLSVYISHGVKPHNAAYRYTIRPVCGQ